MRITYLCLQATCQGQASHAHVHEIISGLVKRGNAVKLYEPSGRAREGGALRRGLHFIFVQLRAVLAIRDTDVLYVRNHFATWPTALIAKLLAIPVVQEANGTYRDLYVAWPSLRYASAFVNWAVRKQFVWADAVVAGTKELATWVTRESGNQHVFVIPNGANTTLFHPAAKSKFTFPKPYALFFGALAAWQGIDIIVRARGMNSWPKGVSLVVVGDGQQRPVVDEAAQRRELIHIPRIPYEQMPGVVANALVGLSPKTNIAGHASVGLSPLKVYETMACGTPVIVTDMPGMSDVVQDADAGCVIGFEDPAAIAETVALLNANRELRNQLGRNGRIAAELKHSWDRRAADTLEVLQAVATKQGSDVNARTAGTQA